MTTTDSSPPAPASAWPAMVLTAGLGTRMAPLSSVRAKPAVPVAGVPLAGRVLRWLAAAGVRDAVLNLHHKPETLTAVIGDGSPWGIRVRYSFEPTVLGSAGGPARALPLLASSRFFLINGDTLCDVELQAMAAQHVATGARVTLALVPNPDRLHYGGVSVAPDGVITGFKGRGPENDGWHFVGVQVVDADVFAGLDPNTPAESVGSLYRGMTAAEPGSVRAFCGTWRFDDIGTAADYLATSLEWAARERERPAEAGRHESGEPASRHDNATGTTGIRPADVSRATSREAGRHESAKQTEDLLTGRDCLVADDAVIERSVLWDRVVVGRGAQLRECVVADDVTIAAGVKLERCVVVSGAAVPADAPGERVAGLLLAPLDAYRPKDVR